MIPERETFGGTWPFAPRYFEGNGFRMHYVDEGKGEPIICLHGEPTWGYLYRRFIPPLSKTNRVIVPDMALERDTSRSRVLAQEPCREPSASGRRARSQEHYLRNPGLGRPDRGRLRVAPSGPDQKAILTQHAHRVRAG